MLRSFGQLVRDSSIKSHVGDFVAAPAWCWRTCTWRATSRVTNAAPSQSFLCRQLSSATSSAVRNAHLQRMEAMECTRRPGMLAFWGSTGGQRGRASSISWSRRSFSSMPPDTVVYSIMLVNFGVFMTWQGDSLKRFMSTHFTTSYSHIKAGYLHTLLTHAVSHAQPMHLFSNMFTFYFFGSSLGGIIGSGRLLQLYAASAITGGLAQSFFDRRSVGLGASAAVNAIVIFSVLLNPTATYLIYGIVPAPAWALGLGWLAYDGMGAYKGVGNVAYLAHLGGAAIGAVAFAAFAAGVW
eukprot:jgi/Ulvmu1/1803/UM119_0021.1